MIARPRLCDAPTVSPRRQRAHRLIRYIESVGGHVTRAEAAAVAGAATGYGLDTVLADATRMDARLYEADAWDWTPVGYGCEIRHRVIVYGLLADDCPCVACRARRGRR